MPIDEERSVIAIFGANDPADGELAAARALGEQVAGLGAVLLTGGDGSDPRTVKDAALVAVDAVGTPDEPATWVGVRNRDRAAPPEWRRPQAVVVTPGWGHRRNFVEACLCDAAVVIGANSPGAASEALFCLYLGRPVVIVRRPAHAATDPRTLRELARTRIREPRRPRLAVDIGIAGAYAWADRAGTRPDIQDLPTDDAAAAQVGTGIRTRIDRASLRPDLDTLVDEPSSDDYVRAALCDAGRRPAGLPGQ